jgi:glycosyltransferase involved in cell wall biosynthesis
MDIVVASRWMLERVNASPFYSHCEKHLIPFGVDLDVFCPKNPAAIRRELGVPCDRLVIMFRGLDAPAKGLIYLLQALERIRDRKTPVYLLIVNGSGFFSQLRDRFEIREISVVTDTKEMARIYQAADIFLSPSLQETFGMMSVEAMACGIACVITEDTPLPEITRAPEAGLVVPRRDPELLADAIDRLLDDIELRNKLGRRGRELAIELYDFRSYARRMRELYIYAQEKKGEATYH